MRQPRISQILAADFLLLTAGRFLYSPAGPFISGFSIDATTGVPTPLRGSPFPAGNGLAIPATLTFAKGSS